MYLANLSKDHHMYVLVDVRDNFVWSVPGVEEMRFEQGDSTPPIVVEYWAQFSALLM